MSRLSSLSANALRAMFSPDADETLIVLLTFEGPGIATPIRLADNYLQRLSETDDEVTYGLISNGQEYVFLPFNISLPTEEQSAETRCSITMHDVTQYLTPIIRTITSAPTVTVTLVLSSTPNVVEATFPGFLMGSISYNKDTVTATLSIESLAVEPFPAHTFTPSHFPGLF